MCQNVLFILCNMLFFSFIGYILEEIFRETDKGIRYKYTNKFDSCTSNDICLKNNVLRRTKYKLRSYPQNQFYNDGISLYYKFFYIINSLFVNYKSVEVQNSGAYGVRV